MFTHRPSPTTRSDTKRRTLEPSDDRHSSTPSDPRGPRCVQRGFADRTALVRCGNRVPQFRRFVSLSARADFLTLNVDLLSEGRYKGAHAITKGRRSTPWRTRDCQAGRPPKGFAALDETNLERRRSHEAGDDVGQAILHRIVKIWCRPSDVLAERALPREFLRRSRSPTRRRNKPPPSREMRVRRRACAVTATRIIAPGGWVDGEP